MNAQLNIAASYAVHPLQPGWNITASHHEYIYTLEGVGFIAAMTASTAQYSFHPVQ
ncbi:hypothetical protein AURDEDRAFT_171742 [Auricularia subglabra TFB-10046 SS5]|nr:hypothetical protein AURDEDRAFT_171742 [Auricularia subglabra TFB-10046 SS5]